MSLLSFIPPLHFLSSFVAILWLKCGNMSHSTQDPDAVGISGSHGNEAAELVNWYLTVPVYTLTLTQRLSVTFHSI